MTLSSKTIHALNFVHCFLMLVKTCFWYLLHCCFYHLFFLVYAATICNSNSSCNNCKYYQNPQCHFSNVKVASNTNSLVFLHVTSEIVMRYILKLSEILHGVMRIVSYFLIWSPLASVPCSGNLFFLCFRHLSGNIG